MVYANSRYTDNAILSSLDEQIAEHEAAIARLQEQKIRANTSELPKKINIIGSAFARAEVEGFITNSLFTQVVSLYSLPSDLNLLKESFPLTQEAIMPSTVEGEQPGALEAAAAKSARMPENTPRVDVKAPLNERQQPTEAAADSTTKEIELKEALSPTMPETHPKGRVKKIKKTIDGVAVTRKTREATPPKAVPPAAKKHEAATVQPPVVAVEEVKEAAPKVAAPKTPAAAPKKPAAKVVAQKPAEPEEPAYEEDQDEENFNTRSGNQIDSYGNQGYADEGNFDDTEEDHDPIPSNVVDTRLALQDIEPFGNRMRLIQRLNAASIFTLGDIISRSEADFSRLRGIQDVTVKQTKALLNEIGVQFKKNAA